jgi:hypothetical protein
MQGQSTYTPRLVLFDSKGSLGAVPPQGSLYATAPSPAAPTNGRLDCFGDVQRRSRCSSLVEKAARHDRQPGFRFGLVPGACKNTRIDCDGGNGWILDNKNPQTIT